MSKEGIRYTNMFESLSSYIISNFTEEFDFVFKEDISPEKNLIKCLEMVKEERERDEASIAQALKYIRSNSTETGIRLLESLLSENYRYDKK